MSLKQPAHRAGKGIRSPRAIGATLVALWLASIGLLGDGAGRSQPTAPPPLQTKPALTPEPGKSPAASGELDPSNKEKELLERIRKLKAPRWRSFGSCRYDWSAWRLSEGDVRTTAVECGEPPVAASIAVHCPSLKLTRRTGAGPWEEWRLPLSVEESKPIGGEDRMTASLCANAKPAVAPAATGSTAKPKPSPNPRPNPNPKAP